MSKRILAGALTMLVITGITIGAVLAQPADATPAPTATTGPVGSPR